MDQLRGPSLDLNMKTLYYLGVWRPKGEPKTWQSTCRYVSIYILYINTVYHILVTYLVDVYTSLDDPAGCMEDLIYVLQFFVAVSKIATIFHQTDKISNMYLILKEMRAQHPSEDDYEADLMNKVDLICNFLSRTTVAVFNMFCLFFNVSFFIMLGLPHRRLQARGWFPYDEKGFPAFELTYLGLGLELHLYATMIAASDVLFICWLVNIVGQLKLINHKFLNIRERAVKNIEERGLSEENSRALELKLISELPLRGLGDMRIHSRTLPENPNRIIPASGPQGMQEVSRTYRLNRNPSHQGQQGVKSDSRTFKPNRNLPHPRKLEMQEGSRRSRSQQRQRNLEDVADPSLNLGRHPSARTLEEGRGWERNSVRIRNTGHQNELSYYSTGLESLRRKPSDECVWWRVKSQQDRREAKQSSKQFLISVEMKRLFIENVQHHQAVLQLWSMIGSTFNPMLMFQIICYLGLTALIAYYIALIPHIDAKAIGMMQVMMASVIELFFSCFLATLITEECSNVREAVYACAWLDATTEFKKYMNIVISTANKPQGMLVAGYLEVSLEMFTRASKTSYSLFTTINTLFSVMARSAAQKASTTNL